MTFTLLPGCNRKARFAPMAAMCRAGGVFLRGGQGVLKNGAFICTNATFKVNLHKRAGT